jgi:D-serine deaminase-like pyridoxal phosphate-dependent protein
MQTPYEIEDVTQIFSPGLVIYRDLVEHNLKEMIRIAGGPERLCPHCKTHKTREITKMEIELGIASHKCATIAEAELLAHMGVEDILVAYQLVGPNIERLIRLMDKFPRTRFATIVDSPIALESLSTAMDVTGKEVAVLLDLDPGMGRTGIEIGPDAITLYEMIACSPGVTTGGLHWYDGHNRQSDLDERSTAVDVGWNQFTQFRDQLLLSGLPVPRIVAAGTGSFPILAEKGEPNLQLSPGTTVYHDAAMVELFPEMPFVPALGILTRVISHNRPGHLTLDVGHKSCAADQPAGKRLAFPDVPDAVEVQQSEEHLVIATELANQFALGDELIALPRHACPTSAVHAFATIVSGGKVIDRWEIIARDRVLTV